MQITFSVNGQIQLSRNLRISAAKISNLKPFYTEAINIVHDRSNDIFKNEGRNTEKNPKWKELAPKTLVARSRRYGIYKAAPNNPRMLRWTGKLQDNIRKEITNQKGLLQYLQFYATFHQDGSSKLPKRAIIDLSNDTNRKIIKAMQKNINDAIGISGKQL